MAKRPISANGLNRAVTNFARNAAKSYHPRFHVKAWCIVDLDVSSCALLFVFLLLLQGENIMFLELDMPNRTTRDYEGPTLAPHLQAALDTALKDEEDIEVDDS